MMDTQCVVNKQLKDAEKNEIIYKHPGAVAIQWFEQWPAMAITLQANCKYNTFNVDADLAYMLTQNHYLQDTQKKSITLV
uniref:Uncharacterized protein n=1 Tax=Romanomermis culicivorax TaxID=13658 RepID=A0A915JVR0_ROMCU